MNSPVCDSFISPKESQNQNSTVHAFTAGKNHSILTQLKMETTNFSKTSQAILLMATSAHSSNTNTSSNMKGKGKSKAILLQAWTGP
jgi:hypothetical protein